LLVFISTTPGTLSPPAPPNDTGAHGSILWKYQYLSGKLLYRIRGSQ
jgi:hypothetical protein